MSGPGTKWSEPAPECVCLPKVGKRSQGPFVTSQRAGDADDCKETANVKESQRIQFMFNQRQRLCLMKQIQ